MTSTRADREPGRASGSGRAWLARLVVLGGLAATISFAGPKAWRVAEAHLRTDATVGAPVDTERVGLLAAPEWARGPALRALLEDLEPRLRGPVRILDDDGARALALRLESSAWITMATLERRFPDRFVVSLSLREPVCAVVVDDRQVALLDAEGVLLPTAGERFTLPEVVLDGPWPLEPADFGQPVRDARARAAVAVAVEWRDQIASVLPDAPELVEVDARNIGWRYVADPRVSEIVVVLRRADGGYASFHYGRAEAVGGRPDAATRRAILASILAEFPGLENVERGDLRLLNGWRDELRPQSLTADAVR